MWILWWHKHSDLSTKYVSPWVRAWLLQPLQIACSQGLPLAFDWGLTLSVSAGQQNLARHNVLIIHSYILPFTHVIILFDYLFSWHYRYPAGSGGYREVNSTTKCNINLTIVMILTWCCKCIIRIWPHLRLGDTSWAGGIWAELWLFWGWGTQFPNFWLVLFI